MNFARREKTAELNSLFTGKELRRMLEGTDYYGVDMFFPFTASFIDRTYGFEGRCELIRMNVKYGVL